VVHFFTPFLLIGGFLFLIRVIRAIRGSIFCLRGAVMPHDNFADGVCKMGRASCSRANRIM
jgi:hypothetical protein